MSDLRRVTFSILSNVIHTVIYPSKANNYQSLSHGMGRYPDLVVVQLKLTNGYVSEAGGTKCYIQLFDFLSQKKYETLFTKHLDPLFYGCFVNKVPDFQWVFEMARVLFVCFFSISGII